MIIVEDALVSEDILEKHFVCNVSVCKGICCIEGDAGAPLANGERKIIEENLPHIRPEMDESGIETLDTFGVSENDSFDEEVTTCKPNKECTFVVRKNGILQCAIEIANAKNNFDFKKPISCHLYPIRIKKYGEYHALNYHKWSICSAACSNGEDKGVRVYQFAKDALVRKFGEKWYDTLTFTAGQYFNSMEK